MRKEGTFGLTAENRRKQVPKYYDISRAPLEPGDILTIFDEQTETRSTLVIESIAELPDKSGRKTLVTILETTAANVEAGVKFDMTIEYGAVTNGTILKKVDTNSGLDEVQLLNLYAVQLYKWLMTRGANDYQAKFKDCVQWLMDANYFPNDTYANNQNRLRAVIAAKPRLLTSKKGGWVQASGRDLNTEMLGGLAQKLGGASISQPKVVKWGQFTAGVRLIMESGIFGEYIIED